MSASLHLIKTDQSLSLVITPIDDRIDVEVSGNLEHSQGMLEEFSKLNVELIEKQSKKQLDRTTLMINGKFNRGKFNRPAHHPAGSNLTRRKNLLRKQLQLNISKSLGALDLVSILFGS